MSKANLLALAIAQHQARDAVDAARVREMSIDAGDATGIEGAEAFQALESLRLTGKKTLSVAGLSALARLRVLVLGAYAIKDLSALAALPLRRAELILQRGPDLKGLSSESLLDLSVWNSGLTTLEGTHLPRLRRLDVSMNKLADLRSVAAISTLRSLNLENNPAGDLRPLASLTELRSLSVVGMKKAKDLAPLGELRQLASLSLTGVGAKKVDAFAHLAEGRDDPPRLPWPAAVVRAGLAGEREVEHVATLDVIEVGAEPWTQAAALTGVRMLWADAVTSFDELASVPDLLDLVVRCVMNRPDTGPWTLEPIDLLGLTRAPSLSRLRIEHPLTSLDAVPTLPGLRHLELTTESTEPVSIGGIERFAGLGTLTVRGSIVDDAPMARAPQVELIRA